MWRRIQVPTGGTFWDLRVAIQDAMGWLDCHLHEFAIALPGGGDCDRIGIPDDEWPTETPMLPGWEVPVGEAKS